MLEIWDSLDPFGDVERHLHENGFIGGPDDRVADVFFAYRI